MKTTSQLEIVGCFRNLFSLPTKSLLTEQISENKISFGVCCENPSFSNNFPLCQELGLSSQFMYVPAANLALSMVCTSSDLNLSASGYFSMVTLRTYLLCLHMYIYTFFWRKQVQAPLVNERENEFYVPIICACFWHYTDFLIIF
jgi:hypothetical protein